MTEQKQHPHAEFLRAIADGEPLDAFEVRTRQHPDNKWTVIGGLLAQILLYPDEWQVRRKPKKLQIGDLWVDPPMRVAPKDGTTYWLADPTARELTSVSWDSDTSDRYWLKSGLCHLTQEAAEAHRRALILVSGGTP